MDNLGNQLRIVRERLGFTLREVAAHTRETAVERGSPKYQISVSWLRRIESNPEHEISALRLIALLDLYKITLAELLGVDQTLEIGDGAGGVIPNIARTTLLVTGAVEVNARLALPDDSHLVVPPMKTEMHREALPQRNARFLRAIIGKQRNYLDPIVPAGTLVLVDTHRRSLMLKINIEAEIQRPMFLIELRDGHICCWCELVDRDESRIVILPHPCTRLRAVQLRLGRDAAVRGQIVAVRIPTVFGES